MPSRRLAHIGSQLKSPGVSIFGIKNPLLRVRGLPVGHSIKVTVQRGEEQALGDATKDGDFPIPEGDWLVIECSVICRQLVCDVISTKAA